MGTIYSRIQHGNEQKRSTKVFKAKLGSAPKNLKNFF